MTDRYEKIRKARKALEDLRERCAREAERRRTTMTDRYENILEALEELRRKQRAVKHWNKLADDVEHSADLGLLDTNVAKERADCYRRTARAIQHDLPEKATQLVEALRQIAE